MELTNGVSKLKDFIKRYKYVVAIVAVGVLLLLVPAGTTKNNEASNNPVTEYIQETFEEQLARILSNVEGAGTVDVMLSYTQGEEIIYQTDENDSTNASTETNNKKTVTVTDAQRNQVGLIKQRNPAVYKGVIIVCQGADQADVRYNLICAVSKLTGLGADKISVLKMK